MTNNYVYDMLFDTTRKSRLYRQQLILNGLFTLASSLAAGVDIRTDSATAAVYNMLVDELGEAVLIAEIDNLITLYFVKEGND